MADSKQELKTRGSDIYLLSYDMESFDNFQYETASSYGGIPVVDDTSSIVSGYTTNTQNRLPADLSGLSSLSISGDTHHHAVNGHGHGTDSQTLAKAAVIDEDLDGVLDDLKDGSAVELPPHACR